MSRWYEDKVQTKSTKHTGTTHDLSVGYGYGVAKGKDVMLGDMYYRLMEKQPGDDIFAYMKWIEAREDELSRHKDGASYTKGSKRITKEQVAEIVAEMKEAAETVIYVHTMPSYAVEEVVEILGENKKLSAAERKGCEARVREALEFVHQEGVPEKYYLRPRYNEKTRTFDRPEVSKDQIINVAFDLLKQLKAEAPAHDMGEDE